MNEFQFILLTVFLVFTMIFLTNKIISKRKRQKKIIPKDEKFNGSLNNLDKIVEGVSKKDKEQIETEKQSEKDDGISDYEKRISKSPAKKSRYNSKEKNKTKKINLKDSIISNAIIQKKTNRK